jgi:hypothetical protein
MMKHALLILSMVLAGCSQLPTEPGRTADAQQPGTVQLQAERTSPTTVLLTLRNDSGSALGYNLCTTAMERQSGGSWNDVPSDGACTMELRILASGNTATYTRQIPAGLPSGEYRFVTQIESPLGSTQTRIASNTISLP